MFLEVSHVWRVRACGPEALSGRATSWTGHRNLAPWSSQNLLAPSLPSGYCVIDTYLPNWIYLHVEVVVDLHVWHPFGIASLLHDQDPYEWYHPLQVSRSKYSAKLGKAHCRASPTCLPTRPLPRLSTAPFIPCIHSCIQCISLSPLIGGALACDASRHTQVVEWWRISLPSLNDRLPIYHKRNVWLSARPQ
jgi:hypothetical protein